MPLSLPVSTLSEGLAKAPRLRTMSITGQLTGGGGGAALATSPLQPRGCGSSSRRQSFVWDADFEFSRTEGTGVSACEEAGYVFGAHEHGVRGKAGTPGFWAPEMLFYERDGKGRRYGPAVDYWSLGCLVYALLAARGPFTIIGGDTSDDNAATLNSDPDLSLPEFSAAATSLMRVGVSPVEQCVCVCALHFVKPELVCKRDTPTHPLPFSLHRTRVCRGCCKRTRGAAWDAGLTVCWRSCRTRFLPASTGLPWRPCRYVCECVRVCLRAARERK
jgi:serine/threonine protein kinase